MNRKKLNLSQTVSLQDWKVEPPAFPEFRAKVWARIGDMSQSPTVGWSLQWFKRWSAGWVAVLGMTLIVAAISGWKQGGGGKSRMVSYIGAVDPITRANLAEAP